MVVKIAMMKVFICLKGTICRRNNLRWKDRHEKKATR